MSNKSPAFQFYPDDFIGGTVDMSAEDVGAYIRLLCYQWSRDSIPIGDPSKLQRIAGCDVSQEVLSKFPNGKNHRMEDVKQKYTQFINDKRVAGQNGAKKRWQTHSTPNSDANATPNGSAIVLPIANGMAKNSSPVSLLHTHTHSDAGIPTLEEVVAAAERSCIPRESAESFFNHHQGNNLWINQFGRMIDWRTKLIGWGNRDRSKQPIKSRTTTSQPIVRDWDKPNITESL